MTELQQRAQTTAGVTGGWLLPDNLLENLQLIADGIVAVAGFEVAAIRIRRGDQLELIIDTELPAEVGSRIPVQLMLDDLAVAEDWGMLRGTLAIDVPRNGLRPDAERRRVLERFAGLAARAVASALERESLAAQVAMADTVKSIVRSSSAQLSLDGLLQASERTLLDGFEAQHLWIKTAAEADRAAVEYLPLELRDALPAEIVEFAEQAATYCWHQQCVMIVGEGHPVPRRMSQRHFDHVVALLQGMGMASLVFVPLGAGPECMGSLVLMRSNARRGWTDIECAALLDIGHDLGRAALNARTFEREHDLVTELRAVDGYKSQLLATVSHELKSPLTAVTGHLELLQSGVIPISSQAHSSLNAIGRASKRMSRVIDDLLYLHKVGEPERELDLEPVDLRDLVADALVMTSMTVVAKDLEIHFEAPDEPVLALGESRELDKVVLNLVSNAVKYTPEHRRIHICLESFADVVALAVTDDGIGISEEDQQQLFTEFFRSTNPDAIAETGTGLGLAIVRRIVERHGGTIQLDSVLGAGSTFMVTLRRSS